MKIVVLFLFVVYFSNSGMGFGDLSSSPRSFFWPLRSSSSSSVGSCPSIVSSSPQSVGTSSYSDSQLATVTDWQEKLAYALIVQYGKDSVQAKLYAKKLLEEGFPRAMILENIRPTQSVIMYPRESLEELSKRIDGLYHMRLLYYKQNSEWKKNLKSLVAQGVLLPEHLRFFPEHYYTEFGQCISPDEQPIVRELWVYTIIDNYSK